MPIVEAEKTCRDLEKELQKNGEISQAEINDISQLKYKAWDKALNTVWGILKEAIPKENMEALTKEQMQWINDKETAAQKAAQDAGGSSMAVSAYGETAEQWTKDRLEFLISIVTGKNISLSSRSDATGHGNGSDFTSIVIGSDLAKILYCNDKFYCQDYGKLVSLDEYYNEFLSTSQVPVKVTKIAAVDMDDDNIQELLLWLTVNENVDYGVVVLHSDRQQIVGQTFAYREINSIKKDGTFWWSGSSANNGAARLVFDKDDWKYENVSSEGFDDKEDIQWYDFPLLIFTD